MASYCCFRKPRKHSPIFIIQRYRSISLQDTLCLVLRPEGEVVVIEGIGGLGKTWAAKAAFEAARNSNLFDVYIWVSLSESCSLRRCIEKIAACLSSDTGEDLPSRIREHLARRKFLLVLDNAYFTEENILEHLGIPHPREQSLGSKVIVTTRTGRALAVMEPAIVITPQPLTTQGSYDLLREKIGKGISPSDTLINYCDGMPLSIILLAGALCDVPTQEEFSELISTAQAHKLSNAMIRLVNFAYRRLPSDTARHCFLYCLLFPDDEAIPVKDLIIFWIMDGLIQEARDFHDANCIAMEILQVILKHRLLYLEDDDHVRMHDVIRETVSLLGRNNGYWYFDNYVRLDYLAKLRRRISVMNMTKEELCGSPYCHWTSTLLLRRNCHLRTISEEFFWLYGNA